MYIVVSTGLRKSTFHEQTPVDYYFLMKVKKKTDWLYPMMCSFVRHHSFWSYYSPRRCETSRGKRKDLVGECWPNGGNFFSKGKKPPWPLRGKISPRLRIVPLVKEFNRKVRFSRLAAHEHSNSRTVSVELPLRYREKDPFSTKKGCTIQ